jgi:[ribosomal protein S5]-alanine N-acetyltransferase
MKVTIRKTIQEDAEILTKLINDRDVMKELVGYPSPCPLSKIKKDIEKGLVDWDNKKAYAFTILAEGKIAGQIFLEEPSSDKKGYTVGFFVGKKFWNKGIATNAIKEVVRFGFGELNLDKIVGDNDEDNPASGRAMEKAGFKLNETKKNKKGVDVLYWEICSPLK